MQRVAILGSPGTGKSMLARRLGDRLRLPVVHLDVLFYGPGWSPCAAEFPSRLAEAIAGEGWITDGDFVEETGALRFTRADTIIWIDQPQRLRFARAFRRCITERDRQRPDLPFGCRDRIDRALLQDIWTFDRFERPRIEAALQRWAPDTPVVRLYGDRAIAGFLERVT